MEELHLILHKVRGQPAFDVAQKIMIGEEEGWIIPTSGHRAYPAAFWLLSTLNNHENNSEILSIEVAKTTSDPRWTDWPDHYDAKRDDGSHLVNAAREILMRKGLISVAKPAQPMHRRF